LQHTFPSPSFDGALYCLANLLANSTAAPMVVDPSLLETLNRHLASVDQLAFIEKILILYNTVFQNGTRLTDDRRMLRAHPLTKNEWPLLQWRSGT